MPCPFQVFVPSSLLAGANFPVPGSREFEANELKRPGEFEYLDRSAQGRSNVIQRIPCIFPAEQGFRHRDEFETDWLHRHSVCGCGELRLALRHSLRNLRDSAGPWSSGQTVSEPETAVLRREVGRGLYSSLSVIRAVRIRCPFAYWKFESDSLRHPVCCRRDFPRALRHSLRNLRDSAGSWLHGPRGSEPETEGSGPGRRRGLDSSLLASRPVRFRRRFASFC